MYETIDSIRAGDAPWTTYTFQYNGPRPNGTVPQWMDQTYELNTRDALQVIEQQLADPDFKNHCDYSPYMEFQPDGSRVWSNMMSGDWAHKEAVRLTMVEIHLI